MVFVSPIRPCSVELQVKGAGGEFWLVAGDPILSVWGLTEQALSMVDALIHKFVYFMNSQTETLSLHTFIARFRSNLCMSLASSPFQIIGRFFFWYTVFAMYLEKTSQPISNRKYMKNVQHKLDVLWQKTAAGDPT